MRDVSEEDAPPVEAGKTLEFAQWVTGVGLPGCEEPRCLVSLSRKP